ncbi:MAG TPA: ABC transporter permease [Candidatus Acidoferrales bacterium]|nr:ABC transporter permease [Candidatus Acidoferrales bacterium]
MLEARWLRRVTLRLRTLFQRDRVERELEAEFQFHMDQRIELEIARGLSPAEARLAALRAMDGLQQRKEECRDMRRVNRIDDLWRDLQYAGRSLHRSPGFTTLTVLIMALGIGGNTAVFSLVNQILLHPPGVSEPQRIAVVRTKYAKLNLDFELASPPALADARANKQIFEHAGAARLLSINYADRSVPVRLPGAAVSAEWFDVFGARPSLGRVFTADEDQPNANRVVVLAYDAWLRLFGGDPGVVGRTIELNQQPYEMIGVMGRDFHQPRAVDVWVPLALPPQAFASQNWFNGSLSVMFRTQPEVSFAQAEAWLKWNAERVAAAAPSNLRGLVKNWGWGMRASRFADSNAGNTKTPMLILLGAVGLVLLIACANIAGLMLARTSARTRELAVRAALGAGRGRLLRQILSESLVLALAGGVAGVLLARGSMKLLLRLAPESAVSGLAARLDVFVLLFATITTLAAGLFFGLAPAWQSSRVDPYHALKRGGRGVSGARQGLRSGLVVAEAALALVLLVAAGLFLRSFARLQTVNPGFDPRGVVTAAYSLPPASANPVKQAAFARNVLDHLQGAKGVTAASIGWPIPFSNDLEGAAFRIEGRSLPAGEAVPQGERRWVTPDYLRTLRIRLERGRFFGDLDRADTEPVLVIDETLARQYWPDEDPLGKRIQPMSGEGWYTIVGTVDHVMQSDLAGDTGRGVFYASLYQRPTAMGSILVKTSGDRSAAAAAIRDAVRAADPKLPLYDIKPMEALLANSLAPRRFAMRLLGLFAAAALLLAALGLYGVLTFAVTERTREIGIRIALGAERGALLRLVVGQGLRLAAAGVAIGIAAAGLFGRLIESQLFEVRAFDPLTIAVMVCALMAAALLASWLPARRAMRADPAVTLRYE